MFSTVLPLMARNRLPIIPKKVSQEPLGLCALR